MSNFNEKDHPRDSDGRFTSSSGSGDTAAEKKRLAEITSSNKFVGADEFRYILKSDNTKAESHPAHIYAKNDEQAKYMQMTHSEFVSDMADANIELKSNPNPKDRRKAYIIPKSEIANLKNLDKVKQGWKLSEIDNETLLVYRDKPFNEKR